MTDQSLRANVNENFQVCVTRCGCHVIQFVSRFGLAATFGLLQSTIIIRRHSYFPIYAENKSLVFTISLYHV